MAVPHWASPSRPARIDSISFPNGNGYYLQTVQPGVRHVRVLYNNPCMQGSEPMLAINTSLLCHPLKNNSIEPSVGEVFNHR